MTDQHRATPEQWKTVEIYAEDGSDEDNTTDSCILELRARVEALEAAQLEQAESGRFCTDAIVRRVDALEAAQGYQFRSATEKVPTTRLYSYSVGPAKPLDELGQGHTLVSPEPASAEAQPAGGVGREGGQCDQRRRRAR
jgi:hypothetical protein